MRDQNGLASRDSAEAGLMLNLSALTARELEVLDLLALGEPSRLLARRLGITERTVRAHCSNIIRKLELRSRLQAAIVSHLHADEIRKAAALMAETEVGEQAQKGGPPPSSLSTTC